MTPGPLYDCQGQSHLTTKIEVGVKIQNCGGIEDFDFYERKQYNLEDTIVPLCIPLNCINDKLFFDSNIINSLYAQGFMQFNLVKENDTMKIMIANMKMGSLYPIKFYIENVPFIKGNFILRLQNHVIIEEQIQDELSLVYSLYNGIYKETYHGWDITPPDWQTLKVREKSGIRMFFKRLFKRK